MLDESEEAKLAGRPNVNQSMLTSRSPASDPFIFSCIARTVLGCWKRAVLPTRKDAPRLHRVSGSRWKGQGSKEVPVRWYIAEDRGKTYIYTSLVNPRKVLLCSSRGAVEADLLLEVGRRLEVVRNLAGDLEFLLEARVLCLSVPHEPAVAEEKEVDLCVEATQGP